MAEQNFVKLFLGVGCTGLGLILGHTAWKTFRDKPLNVSPLLSKAVDVFRQNKELVALVGDDEGDFKVGIASYSDPWNTLEDDNNQRIKVTIEGPKDNATMHVYGSKNVSTHDQKLSYTLEKLELTFDKVIGKTATILVTDTQEKTLNDTTDHKPLFQSKFL